MHNVLKSHRMLVMKKQIIFALRHYKSISVGALFLTITSCAFNPFKNTQQPHYISTPANIQHSLLTVEASASPAGTRVLETARTMALINKDIVKGSCWDYIHEVFNRAGYPANKRKTVYKSHIHSGPYAHDQIQAGDWVYFKNHNYKNNPHSSIFIQWEDKANKQALMLSYAGEHRRQPARYKVYNLRSAYQIIRAQ